MNCDDYLAMLATLPVDELSYGGARAHAATCRDCDRVTRVVAERERNLQLAYGDLYAAVPATQTATHAMATARRRTVALSYKIGLGVVALATVAVMGLSRTVMPSAKPALVLEAETFRLQCLSPLQAAEALRPHIGKTGKISARAASPLGILEVEASPAEMVIARTMMKHYDNPANAECAVTVRVPPMPAGS